MDKLLEITGVLVILYAIWQYQELKKFRVVPYEMQSDKINQKIKMVVISDLHSFSYGKKNERLVRAVREARPDLILVPGDLIVTSKTEKYDITAEFMEQIAAAAPIVFSNGNHESRAEMPEADCYEQYRIYRRRLEEAGVIILNNASRMIAVPGGQVRVSGLEIPLASYEKGKNPYLEAGFIKEHLGNAASDQFQILLAHNPEFAERYAQWGADLTVCGHNHGGLVNIPGFGSIISSQLIWFPKYDAGEFAVGSRRIYISRGLGTHTFHVRIFNRAELMVITAVPSCGG